MKKGIVFIILIFTLGTGYIYSLEQVWTRALTGNTVAGPLTYRDRVLVAGSDRMLTCLSENGNFLWSTKLPGKSLPFMTISISGTIYIIVEPGILMAFNLDGSILWKLTTTSVPLFSPYEGRDGRFFLVYKNSIRCISSSGLTKWILLLEDSPERQLSETGDGDLLLTCTNHIILRISPFGELLEKVRTDETISALSPIPGGYIAGYSTGLIKAFDVRKKTELVWQLRGQTSACVAITSAEGIILLLYADGSLQALNPTDGSILWKDIKNHPVTGSPFIRYEYGQFNLVFNGYACARSATGFLSWQYPVPEKVHSPVISDSGNIFAIDSDWILYCFRAETRIITEKKTHNTQSYGILNGKSNEYGQPFVSDPVQIYNFFKRVSDSISRSSVGTSEITYARRLNEIMENDTGEQFSGRSFDGMERGRAANLLGQLGSSEYRSTLITQAYGDFDSSLAIGILYGLESLGADSDGKSLSAIRHLIKMAGTRDTAVLCASCDALYSIIRYSAGNTALEGTEILIDFLDAPYNETIQLYARQKIANILH